MIARKKPVVIEAILLEEKEQSIVNAINFISGMPAENDDTVGYIDKLAINAAKENKGIFIQTLEGDMLAKFGDYIIKGVNGEFYPCKPDIFKKTYEIIED